MTEKTSTNKICDALIELQKTIIENTEKIEHMIDDIIESLCPNCER